jgi:hypothetical protein
VLWGAGAIVAVVAAAAGVIVATGSSAGASATSTGTTVAQLAAVHQSDTGPNTATAGTGASTTPAHVCDDGKWTGAGVSVQGRPAGFDAGDLGRTYVWHDANGWHLRTTDAADGPHYYSGTITASPGAHFTDVAKVRLDPGDRLYVDDHNVLHYDFTTYEGIDGVNFRVTACDGDRSHETLGFFLQKQGTDDNPAAIDLGRADHHPTSDPFTVSRTV